MPWDVQQNSGVIQDSHRGMSVQLSMEPSLCAVAHCCRSCRRRIRTAPFVHELLSRRYGVKSIVDKMCWELYQAIQKLRTEDRELDIFGGALNNPNPNPSNSSIHNRAQQALNPII